MSDLEIKIRNAAEEEDYQIRIELIEALVNQAIAEELRRVQFEAVELDTEDETLLWSGKPEDFARWLDERIAKLEGSHD